MLYKAFISYSHAADDRVAPILQSALHRFAKPWNQMRTMRVFLDKGSLSATPKLWSTIQTALTESEFLLLLASPRAAQSEWVPKEVKHWIDLGRADKLLVALTGGEIVWDSNKKDFDWNATTALPRALAGVLSEPPLYVDLRWANAEEDLSLNHPRFRDKIADLSSALQGIPKDALIGEDIRQQHRRVLVRRAVVSALSLLCVGLFAAGLVAYQQRNEARRQANIATARQLAAEAQLMRTREPEQLPAAALMAIESMQRFPTTEADQMLRYALSLLRPPVAVIQHKAALDSTNNAVEARFTPDSARLITVSDNLARVWDVETGKELATLKHDQSVRQFAISPDGAYLATTSGGDIRVFEHWATPQAREINRVSHQSNLGDISFSRTGRYVVTTDERGDATVWTSWQSRDVRLVSKVTSTRGDVIRAAFSDDERSLVTMDEDGRINVWNPETGEARGEVRQPGAITYDHEHLVVLEEREDKTKTIRIMKLPDGPEIGHVTNLEMDTDGGFNTLDFSDSGRFFAVLGSNNVVVVRSLTQGFQVSTLRLPSSGEHVVFQPRGNLLATLSRPRTVQLWDVVSATEVARFIPEEVPDRIAFSPDGKRLATVGSLTVQVWDIANMSAPRLGRGANAATFSPDGQFVAAGGLGSTVQVFAAPSGALANELPKLPSDVRAVEISGSGRYLAAAGHYDADVYTEWRITPRRIAHIHRKDIVHALAFSSDERYLVTGGSDKTIVVWADWQTGEPRAASQIALSTGVSDVAFSPGSTYLAAAGGDGVVRLWTAWNTANPIESGQLRHESPRKDSTIRLTTIAFSPDGRYLAVATDYPQTYVWADWSTAKPRQVARFDDTSISSGRAFSPDSTYLTVHNGTSVRVLELATGRELVRATSEMSRVSAFSPDGRYIIAAGGISFWRADDMIREACGRLKFDIGLAEWRRVRQAPAAAGPCAIANKR